MFANILKSSETAVELSKFPRNFILIEFIHETIMQRCYRMHIKFNVSFNYYYEFLVTTDRKLLRSHSIRGFRDGAS